MKRLIICVGIILVLSTPVFAEQKPQQITTQSWMGLSGLYVVPTARLIGKNRLAVGFNEAKHTEFINSGKFTDRQIRAVGTVGITDWLEFSGNYMNDLLTVAAPPNLNNESFGAVDLKVRLLKESRTKWYPEVAFAIRDIADSTANVGPLEHVHPGRKFFLIGTKRVAENAEGRFIDVTLGLTNDSNTTTGMFGGEIALSNNLSLIAEGMWDSPFLDFRNFGQNNQAGRFIFDTGLRYYPELAPGLVLDTGVVGDSEFEFSFGLSYVFRL